VLLFFFFSKLFSSSGVDYVVGVVFEWGENDSCLIIISQFILESLKIIFI
jgi:hypothetical protein